jgi:CRP/FNR family transcriptional regulator, cyclic AMP receptor protein
MPARLSNGSVVRLLEIDPELGKELSGERLEAARRDTIGLVRTLPPGPWSWSDYRRFDPTVIGLFVIDGVLAREVSLSNTTCTELLGHGDLLRPWDEHGPYAPVPSSVEWTVLESTAVAVLDARFAGVTARWPEVLSAVTGRAVQRARWLSVQLAIRCLTRVDVRVLVLFWHLADRWGRVQPDGVLLPMRLTHELLGRLIAVRRASVTASLGRLRERGYIERRPDRTWLLHSEGLKAVPDLYRRAPHRDVVRDPQEGGT